MQEVSKSDLERWLIFGHGKSDMEGDSKLQIRQEGEKNHTAFCLAGKVEGTKGKRKRESQKGTEFAFDFIRNKRPWRADSTEKQL